MTADSTHEDLVNKYISDYFKDKPNTTNVTLKSVKFIQKKQY
jgi:hypothetical protein